MWVRKDKQIHTHTFRKTISGNHVRAWFNKYRTYTVDKYSDTVDTIKT